MNFSYDDAAYFIDRASSLLAVGDVTGATESVAAADSTLAVAPLRGLARDAHTYAVAAVAAMREQPSDGERAQTYLELCARTVEEMAAYERAVLFERTARKRGRTGVSERSPRRAPPSAPDTGCGW